MLGQVNEWICHTGDGALPNTDPLPLHSAIVLEGAQSERGLAENQKESQSHPLISQMGKLRPPSVGEESCSIYHLGLGGVLAYPSPQLLEGPGSVQTGRGSPSLQFKDPYPRVPPRSGTETLSQAFQTRYPGLTF